MLRRLRAAQVGALTLMVLAGCRSFQDLQLPERRVDLPADVTAAIVAGAVRSALPCESVAASCGAPVRREPDGSYRIELTGNGRGHWLAVSNQRLRIRCAPHSNRAVVAAEALSRSERPTGFGYRSRATIVILVTPEQHGSRVALDVPDDVEVELAGRVQRALDLAESIDGAGPGLNEPNLASWRLARLLQAAAATDDQAERGELLQRAIRLPNAPAFAHGELAMIASANGEHARALRHLRLAACASSDPRERAHYAGRAHDLHEDRTNPDRMRDRAFVLMVNDRLETAKQMVYGASRRQRQPIIDYRLLSQIHRHQGQHDEARAAELLAREYAIELGFGGSRAANATALAELPAIGPLPAQPPAGR